MGRLIVNADDFGLTSGVNRAIVELHGAGAITSTTLMARAAATDEAIAIAGSIPSLRVGCHVILADGEPVLPAHEIPTLIDSKTGRFQSSLSAFLMRLFTGRVRAAEIEAEARAQIESLQSRGLQLTHVDTHKHTHMFPAVLRPVLRAARACSIHAVRNPFEPAWAVRATRRSGLTRAAEVTLLRWLEPVCRRIIAEEGFSTTDGTIAIVGTGALDVPTLRALLHQLPAGTWELVTHPGYNDADLQRVRTRLRASRQIELAALSTLKEFPSIERINFGDLPAANPLETKP
jgi:hopanoid biosynthesis associated protein HpnK